MAKYEEDEDVGEKPLGLDVVTGDASEFLLDFGLDLGELHETDESEGERGVLGGFDDLVDARHSGKFGELVDGGVGDEGEREDRDEVDEEPGLEVAISDLSPVTYESLHFIVVSREKGEDDIEEEDRIDEGLDDLPLHFVSVIKGDPERSHN